MIVVELFLYRRWVDDMNNRLLVALLLLIAAIVPVSIAIDLLVWPGSDTKFGCHIDWVGIIPVGFYCT
jgi:hypothetical protein